MQCQWRLPCAELTRRLLEGPSGMKLISVKGLQHYFSIEQSESIAHKAMVYDDDSNYWIQHDCSLTECDLAIQFAA